MEAGVFCLGSLALVGLGVAAAVGFRLALALWVQAEQQARQQEMGRLQQTIADLNRITAAQQDQILALTT